MCRKSITFAQNFENCAMNDISSFNSFIENTIKDNWLLDALTDYKGITLQYHDVARKIEKLHIMMEAAGIQKGDRIAVCGRNSAHWAVAFLATITYGAVIVPILHEFNAEQIHNIVNHSESRLLFVGDYVVKAINPDEMPHLEGIFNLPDFSLHLSRSEKLTDARERLNELFGHRFPNAYRKEDIHWHQDTAEELCMINYTSGTTGFSKGVMLPYRAIWGNVDFCLKNLAIHMPKFSKMLNILPMAHMYGLAIEFLFPFTVGYGTTECAPLISYSDYHVFQPGSCGQPLPNMEVKIASADPLNVEGEIIARGPNVMLGYYKNQEATQRAIDSEGWYHTGDLATMGPEGHIFIRGRLKNMLLGANGQNVYPEEIEDKLNSLAMVSESLIVQRGDKLVALVHPDMDEVKAMGFGQEELEQLMEQNRQELNAQLPVYSKLQAFELLEEEFQKTPKKSIKRYLYK